MAVCEHPRVATELYTSAAFKPWMINHMSLDSRGWTKNISASINQRRPPTALRESFIGKINWICCASLLPIPIEFAVQNCEVCEHATFSGCGAPSLLGQGKAVESRVIDMDPKYWRTCACMAAFYPPAPSLKYCHRWSCHTDDWWRVRLWRAFNAITMSSAWRSKMSSTGSGGPSP